MHFAYLTVHVATCYHVATMNEAERLTEKENNMKYFANINSLDELKKEFRRLAMIHHPDRGGDVEAMKAINNEYDMMFPALKAKTAAQTTETAQSTRSEFYTANGWKGERYEAGRSLKEIAQLVRTYIKEFFPDYRFSVRTSYASMCQELHVDMKEAPADIFKTYEEMTDEDINECWRKAVRNDVWTLNNWSKAEEKAEFERIWSKYGAFYKCLTDRTRATVKAVDEYVNSFNFDDCDSMIDYFDVNFYFFGCLQSPGAVKIIPRAPRAEKRPAKAEKPEQTAPAKLPALRVEFNTECDGIEVYFQPKPSQETRDALKAAGYRWHSVKKCWYAKRSEERLQALKKIEGAA